VGGCIAQCRIIRITLLTLDTDGPTANIEYVSAALAAAAMLVLMLLLAPAMLCCCSAAAAAAAAAAAVVSFDQACPQMTTSLVHTATQRNRHEVVIRKTRPAVY
jgi:hypothetical protein